MNTQNEQLLESNLIAQLNGNGYSIVEAQSEDSLLKT